MLPVTGDISADGCPFFYIDVFYKSVSADIDCVFRTGQGTGQIIFPDLGPVQLICRRIEYVLIHVRQFQIFRIVNRAGLLFHTPFVTDIGAPVFICRAVSAGAKIKTHACAALTFSCYRTRLINHLVASVGNQDTVTPETVRMNFRCRGNNHSVLHAIYPDANSARSIG